jgi:decaprenylphospho-beta-D-erythro-pentofuranosid-2-ulose 2-reductase
MDYVLIIGAKSDIAKAIAKEYAKNGYNLYLAARNVKELEGFASDINIKMHSKVELIEFDILNYENHQSFYDRLKKKPLGVISAVGYLGSQKKSQSNFFETKKIIDTNYTGIVSLFNIVANNFEERGSGFIVGVSSVAGDRGRKSNYIYGSAKSALSTYLSGLRNRMYHSNVHVLTVKPGFVNTKMTKNMDLPKKLTSGVECVAKAIYKSQKEKRNTLYVLSVWRWIMLFIRVIPEFIFKKMKL